MFATKNGNTVPLKMEQTNIEGKAKVVWKENAE
jgi:hypothetical protein